MHHLREVPQKQQFRLRQLQQHILPYYLIEESEELVQRPFELYETQRQL